MTKLITIEQVDPIWGVNLASLKKHRPRLGMPDPVANDWLKPLYDEQAIIDFAKTTDIDALFKRLNKEEWQARKARTLAKQQDIYDRSAIGTFNVARLW